MRKSWGLLFTGCLLLGSHLHADDPATGPNRLAPIVSADEGEVVALPDAVIHDQRAASAAHEPGTYVAPNASSGTRTNTPIAETPVALHVVPREVIEDQGAVRLTEVLRNVSAVAPEKTQGFALTFESAFVRGFSQRMYLDGVDCYAMPPIDLAGVDRVEVLQGPSSVLYGAQEPGGLVNVVPKLPSFDPRNTVKLTLGTDDFYRGELDSTGPLSDRVAYRFVGSAQNSDSFRDDVHTESEYLMPSVTLKLDADTTLTAWAWYYHIDRPNDDGVAFTYDGKPVQPIATNRAGPDHNTQAIDDIAVGLSLEHAFSDAVTWRHKGFLHHFEGSNDVIRYTQPTTAANTVRPRYDASSFDQWNFSYVQDLLVKLDLGATQHELLVGGELQHLEYLYSPNIDTALAAISIFDFDAYPMGPFSPTNGTASRSTTTGYGAFGQDQITLLDGRLHLLAGGRIDGVDQENRNASGTTTATTKAFTWRLGALYELTPWLSPYVAVGTSFNPNSTSRMTVDGSTLDPETGFLYEAGAKLAFFDGKLSLTTSLYQITKDDVAVGDPDNPGFSLNGGRLRSQGLNVDLIGQITPEWQVIANYAYTDTEVLDSDSLPEGESFRNIPLNSGSVWLKYTVQDGRYRGLGLGAGVFAASERSGDNAHSFELPSYARVDVGGWYSWTLASGNEMKVQVNVQNLFDKTYYESSQNTARVQPGEPLGVTASLSYSF